MHNLKRKNSKNTTIVNKSRKLNKTSINTAIAKKDHHNVKNNKMIKKLFPPLIQQQVEEIEQKLITHQSNAHLLVDAFIGIKIARTTAGVRIYPHSDTNDRYFLMALRNLHQAIQALIKQLEQITRFY